LRKNSEEYLPPSDYYAIRLKMAQELILLFNFGYMTGLVQLQKKCLYYVALCHIAWSTAGDYTVKHDDHLCPKYFPYLSGTAVSVITEYRK